MAAVRRGADSGVVVALVIFVVLAFAGIGCAVWFYQQLSLAQKAIRVEQWAFESELHSMFSDNNWELTTQSPSELGVRYTGESYKEVAQKLAEAAEYEKDMLPLLGWASLEGVRSTVAESPVQKEAEARGEGTYATVRGLVEFYEQSYRTLTSEVADLRKRNEDLAGNLNTAREQVVETEQQLRGELSQAVEQFKDDVSKLREDYNKIVAEHDQQRQAAVDWRQKHQQEVNERTREVAELKAQADSWRQQYQKEVMGPGEEAKMVPEGKILVLQSKYEFVVIEGGRDRDVNEDARLVVYNLTPDGKDRRKGVILVGEVGEYTSLATIAEEQEPILEGDYFVSMQRWREFHREAPGVAGG